MQYYLNSLIDNIDSLDSRSAWRKLRKAGNDLRGGDRWKVRGAGGLWHRIHITSRRALFAPYRVAKGPSKNTSFRKSRFTYGDTADGEKFEFYDDWTRPDSAHRVLDKPWIGYTVFSEEDVANEEFQMPRNYLHKIDWKKLDVHRWGDED